MAPLKKHIRMFAHNMRSKSTKAEKILWDTLRDYKTDGFKFRRQVPFDNYIVDFACHSAKLIIEIDGHTHTSDCEVKYDDKRQTFLETRGYKVLRFWNEDVFQSLDQIIAEIETYLVPHAPNPSSRGGGEQSVSTPPSVLRAGTREGNFPLDI